MLIAVDIGNTNVTVGILKDTQTIRSFKFSTFLLKSKAKAARAIKDGFSSYTSELKAVEAVYACSVVPGLNKSAGDVLAAFFKRGVAFVGSGVIVPIINRYRIPAQVGQDRLVNAYAALKIYGPGLVIVDFGTAITFDIVSKKSEYIGGIIVPGLKLMQEALHKKTALLPYVELSRPIEIIGRDTVSSIRAGIVYGIASLCDGIIDRLLKKECKGFKVIATGGDVHLIKPYSAYLSTVEESLILKGLALIYKSQRN